MPIIYKLNFFECKLHIVCTKNKNIKTTRKKNVKLKETSGGNYH